MTANEPATDSLALTVNLPRQLILNQEWPLTVALSNKTDEEVTLSLRKGMATDVKIVVWSTDGAQISRTEYGERHLPGRMLEGVMVDNVISAILKHLKPGESYTWNKIDLGKCFDFTAGEYKVEVSIPVRPVGDVRHEFQVTVLPAPK
jgi:hypothetical protein